MSNNLYADLGIDPGATPEQIKAAHRKAIKRTHPDRVGDDGREEFDRVQRAYVVLADPAKRTRYDETGECDDRPDNTNAKITSFIGVAFRQAFSEVHNVYRNHDLIERTRYHLQNMRQAAVEEVMISNDLVTMKEDLLKRLQVKSTATFDPIGDMIRQEIKQLRRQVESANEAIVGVDASIAHLDHYGFVFEPLQPVQPSPFYTYSSSSV